ncbi:hypothetical protein NPIL_290411 [Nephila pilipes]|uniref:Uncharacterized protein n=1 Tax=Nephila pilipes TaxID=299642 RepID=A0A8X6Q5I7_NEPPI|nr:hypothetical protein NPIL_290411 [Nephila pilipes]
MKASIAAARREGGGGKKTINTRNPGQKIPPFFGEHPLFEFRSGECIGVVCQWSHPSVKNFQFFRACISPCPRGGFGSPGRLVYFILPASAKDVADSGLRKA